MKQFSILSQIVIAMCALVFGGCDSSVENKKSGAAGKAASAGGKLRVVATTTMVADMARVIAGDDAEVIGLMAAGVDPHSYSLPTRAIANLKSADVVLYSGLKLEGRSEELYAPLASKGVLVAAVTDGIDAKDLLVPNQFEGYPDPHVWGDVALWSQCIKQVVETLSAAKPESAATFAERGRKHAEELAELDSWVRERMKTIPESNRILITSHDAFNYFGRAYGLEVVGVQGISTVDKAGLADIAKTVDLIKERDVPAIFGETSVAQDAVNRIAEDAGVTIGGLLFSDSLGPLGETETVNGESYDPGTYAGMIKHNVNTVVEALGKEQATVAP
jgi:manganese/zinc/iron transport system substrate-binding protein